MRKRNAGIGEALLLGVGLSVVAMASPPLAYSAKISATLARPAEDNLEQKFAKFRREQIKQVSYDLSITFQKNSERYQATSVTRLTLANVKAPLSFDWLGDIPTKVVVNGEPITDFRVQLGSLEVPSRHLKSETEVRFEFENSFSKEGNGIQRVVDPEDNQEYIYTDFEPYQAHQLFPCFDQPDLKAYFGLTVTAPKDWTVIGNELPQGEKEEGENKTTTFRPTPLLSPYLLFVGAGPFASWNEREGTTPLAIYARKSLAKYVDADRLFTSAKKGLKFYSGYFGINYPFSKFALVFAPEFLWGGMENPGAIVLNERNLYRGPVASTRLEGRESLILHEMAHMWFGDLVTMKWWNDLWLNESFATYAASLAQERAFDSKIVWMDFASTKSWGYWQDQLPTTHPIEAEVSDARTAKGNFDGITYAKGAAALQQLHFFVGEDAFEEGIQSYFKKHAFGNADRSDFIGAIARAAKKDLGPFTRAWLQSAGVSRVHADFKCQGEGLQALTIWQKPSASKTLSPHRTRVGLFRKTDEGFELKGTLEMDYSGRRTSAKLPKNTACPDFVYPNLDDKDYALFALDRSSVEHAAELLSGGVRDPLLRFLVWKSLGQMVRDTTLSPAKFMEIAQEALSKESNLGVLDQVLGHHSSLGSTYHHFLSPGARAKIAPNFEALLWQRVRSSEPGSSQQILFFDFLVNEAQTGNMLTELRNMLLNNLPPAGLELDQDRRWAIIGALARNGVDQAEELIASEEKRDPSHSGQRHAYVARVAIPTIKAKQAFWNALETPEKFLPNTLESAAGAFHLSNHPELSELFVQDYFDRLHKIDWKKSDYLVEAYFEDLFPDTLCSASLLSKSQAALKKSKGLSVGARRAWIEANDELARCVRIRGLERP